MCGRMEELVDLVRSLDFENVFLSPRGRLGVCGTLPGTGESLRVDNADATRGPEI